MKHGAFDMNDGFNDFFCSRCHKYFLLSILNENW